MTATERWRRLRDRRLAEGLCGRCGERPPHQCRKNELDRAYKQEWRDSHRCVVNGCPLPRGYAFLVCEEHRRIARERYTPKRRRNGPHATPPLPRERLNGAPRPPKRVKPEKPEKRPDPVTEGNAAWRALSDEDRSAA